MQSLIFGMNAYWVSVTAQLMGLQRDVNGHKELSLA